jgi:hypothetical protein
MKLRIKGNSLRLRVSRSELERFASGERIVETIRFGPEPEARLTYALVWDEEIDKMTVRYISRTVTVQIPFASAYNWRSSDLVGLSARIDLGSVGILDVLVEKDFACMDQHHTENEDTFPNPHIKIVC